VRFLGAAMDRLQERPAHFACNVCTGEATTVKHLAEMAANVAGRRVRIDQGAARTGDIRQSLGDPRAAIALTGIKAETALDEGLVETMRWMKSQTMRAAS
jgi:UDP-glucose 4-epimerase